MEKKLVVLRSTAMCVVCCVLCVVCCVLCIVCDVQA